MAISPRRARRLAPAGLAVAVVLAVALAVACDNGGVATAPSSSPTPDATEPDLEATAGFPRNVCATAVAPIGAPEDITPEIFALADESMGTIVDAIESGDIELGQSRFFFQVHPFTHNVDGPLREVDPDLATALCNAVVRIEAQFILSADAEEIAATARDVRDLLALAGRTLEDAP